MTINAEDFLNDNDSALGRSRWIDAIGTELVAELGGFGQTYHARYWHEREFETVARVQEIAKQHGTPITTLSVAWVLANPAITSVILGASRVEQLTDTLAAADYKLDSALKTRLDEVSIEFRRGDAGK